MSTAVEHDLNEWSAVTALHQGIHQGRMSSPRGCVPSSQGSIFQGSMSSSGLLTTCSNS